MPRYLLAGDIGGTHSRLELHQTRDAITSLLYEHEFASRGYASFDALLDQFFGFETVRALAGRVDAACFSVAGPVAGNASRLSNLPWRIDGEAVGARYGIAQVAIVNDFEAVGHGVSELGADQLLTLQGAAAQPGATRLAVGAGTGLGVCIMTWQGGRYAVHASEGGHADFAPVDATQDALLASLRDEFGHVSYERVVSGPGLLRIFRFLQDSGAAVPSPQLLEAMQRQDPAAAISQFALGQREPLAARALDLFVGIYGAFCGNMALATLARGGVYIAGGIARKIAPKLEDGSFIRAFNAKGRFSELLQRYPVHVVTDPRVGLKGALRLIRRDRRGEI